MIPNNNMSVLPFYDSIERQNARKWWVYGKVYPLFTQACYMLPFQVLRDKRERVVGGEVLAAEEYIRKGIIKSNGDIVETGTGCGVSKYNVTGGERVYLSDIPTAYVASGIQSVMLAAYGPIGELITTFNPISEGTYSGVFDVPNQTKTIAVQTYNEAVSTVSGEVQKPTIEVVPIKSFKIYTRRGKLLGDFIGQMNDSGLRVVNDSITGNDVIVYPAMFPAFQGFKNGQYYAEMSDGEQTWYSEMFTCVNDISGYLKIEWWDVDDFYTDAGVIRYKNPLFRNVAYLCADIAKPEYIFEEDGETRDGYFFPAKQISEKRYKFTFLASEYLLDVLRFVRMADFVRITKDGQTYDVDSFLITPEWEDEGDVAVVQAEFDTQTVAKKIGRAYVTTSGDFNNDYNNDYLTK